MTPPEEGTPFQRLLRARRMTRSFRADPVDTATVSQLLHAALRAPSAGNSQGTHLLVLNGPQQTARYWDVALGAQRAAGFTFPGLLRAPLLVLVYADPDAYLDRYGEVDKVATGLGDGTERWAVPYWTVDAAFAAMLLQLAAIDAGLGVLFFGLFDHEQAVAEAFGVPPGVRAVGVVAIGHPDPAGDRPGRSARRPKRPRADVIHEGRW